MTAMEKGRILLAVTGFHPQRWHELLSAEREVVLEPDGAERSVDHLCRGVEAAAEPAVVAAQSARHLLDRRRRRPYLRRSRPARRADREGRRRQPHPAHDRICRLAGARSSSPGHALPCPAEEEDLARAAAAAGRRHLRRHHGARHSSAVRRPRRCWRSASASMAGAAPTGRWRASRPSPARPG